MDLTERELLEIGFDAVDADGGDAPIGLRERILSAASGRRPTAADWAVTAGRGLTPLAAYARTAAELAELLDSLAPDDWTRPSNVGGGSVRDLVAHLVGVERYVLGQLDRRPRIDAPRRADHYPVALAAAADLVDAPPAELANRWWLEAMAVVAAAAELGPAQPTALHHLTGSLGGLLVIRTFELWTHDEDIRRATGREPNPLDPERLTLMSSGLMQSLPLGMALAGTTRPGRTARVELTGPGGGQFLVALAPGEDAGGDVDVVVAADTLELCRLAANRRSADELGLLVVEGDASLVEPMLVGAGSFALD